MSQILINSNNIIDKTRNSTFDIKFDRTVDLTDKKIALSGLSLYYSWRNITSKNNKIYYTWSDGIEYLIELPIGFYEVSDIYSYCRFVMTNNKHYLIDANGSFVYYFEMSVNNTQYSIDIITYPIPTSLPQDYNSPDGFIFQADSKNPVIRLPYGMNEILGYVVDFTTDLNEGVSSILQYQSSQAPNVNPNNTIIIVCDQVENDFNNIGILYSLAPSVNIGSLINIEVSSPLYSKLKQGRFNSLTFRILNAKTYEQMEILDGEINLRFVVI